MSLRSAVYKLFVRRYAPFGVFGGGFEGDDRGFSMDPTASARTIGVVTLEAGRLPEVCGYATGSAWVGPWFTRRRLSLGTIETHQAEVRARLSRIAITASAVQFTLYTEGNLPLKDMLLRKKRVDVFGGIEFDRLADWIDDVGVTRRPAERRLQGTPDIDTFLDLRMSRDGQRLQFEGTLRGDAFPSAEVFIVDQCGGSAGLLDYRTKGGPMSPYYRLFGSGSTTVVARFTRRIPLLADGRLDVAGAGSPVVVN